jgi:hypothetical protein
MNYNNLPYVLILFAVLSCAQKPIHSENSINFKWISFEQNGLKIDHGAMSVPVSLDKIDKQFEMQFDLGLDVNAIYGNSLTSIIKEYPDLVNNIAKGKGYEVFKTKLLIDNNKSNVDSLFLIKNHGQNADFKDLDLIGSIGANEIENRILVIDFPNQKLKIKKELTDTEIEQFEFVPLEYKNRKILLTLNVLGTSQKYIFDTGASLTPITTLDVNFFDLVKGESAKATDTIYLNSWGKKEPFVGAKINTQIKISDQPISIKDKKIYYTSSESIKKTLNEIGVKGLIGNDLFINDKIVIDLVNNRFGIEK